MKKLFSLAVTICIVFSLVACSNGKSTTSTNTTTKTTDNFNSSTEKETKGSNMSTRVIENGTAIKLTIGDTVIPATLNNSTSAKELISRLPYTVSLNRFSHDYCGVMKDPNSYSLFFS